MNALLQETVTSMHSPVVDPEREPAMRVALRNSGWLASTRRDTHALRPERTPVDGGPFEATGRATELAVHEERARVARELHDTVAQTLYSITLGASRVLTLLERSETAQLQDIVEDLLHQASAGQTELRALLHDLRSNEQSQLQAGLTGALASLATGLEARARCQVRLSLADEPDIASATKATLVRIVREALHNIAKHARATHVDLVLEVGPSDVILWLADDGRGFDPSAAYPGHFGLQLMREHAVAIGGALELTSAPGRGTQLRVRVTRRQPPVSEVPTP
jgi:signal transduction histidine kinase